MTHIKNALAALADHHTIVTITITEPTPIGDRSVTTAIGVLHTAEWPDAHTVLSMAIGPRGFGLAPTFPMRESANRRASAAYAVALGMGGV